MKPHSAENEMPLGRAPLSGVLVMIFTVFLAGCDTAVVRDPEATPSPAARNFSPEEMAGARALSLVSSVSLEQSSSPYQQALVCENALVEVIDRAKDAGMTGAGGLATIERARALFTDRVNQMNGQASTPLQRDRAMVRASNPDIAANGRIAIACLKEAARS